MTSSPTHSPLAKYSRSGVRRKFGGEEFFALSKGEQGPTVFVIIGGAKQWDHLQAINEANHIVSCVNEAEAKDRRIAELEALLDEAQTFIDGVKS